MLFSFSMAENALYSGTPKCGLPEVQTPSHLIVVKHRSLQLSPLGSKDSMCKMCLTKMRVHGGMLDKLTNDGKKQGANQCL